MKLKYIDAVDAFSYGGFICIETMKYIAPRWLAEMDTSNGIYLSEKDYALIEHNNKSSHFVLVWSKWAKKF